jgi:hypothetical protein
MRGVLGQEYPGILEYAFSRAYDGEAVPLEQAADYFAWRPPGQTLSVRLEYSAMERINADVMRGFAVTRRRGTETGGILLGRIDRGPELTVHIHDFEVVPCEYSLGPSYHLSERDRDRFRAALDQWRPGPEKDLHAVGYFRSHTREGLEIDEPDRRLFNEFFADPLNVVLLIKPFASKPSMAGFFVQESGVLSTDTPLSFPFVRPAHHVPAPAPVHTADPNGGKPMAAQAPRGRMTAALDAGKEPPEAPPVVLRPERPDIRQPEPHPAFTRPLFADVYMPEPPAWRTRFLQVVFSAALLAFGAVAGYQYAGGTALGIGSKAPPRPADPYEIGLQVSRAQDTVRLTWNHSAAAIQKADRGILLIREGELTRELQIAAPELKSGSILYHHLGPEVLFRMELLLTDSRRLVETATYRSEPPPAAAAEAPK